MDVRGSQRSARTALVAGAVALCVALAGAAYFLRTESKRPEPPASAPAASALQPLFERCEGEPTIESIDGLTRTGCTNQSHPAFMLYQDADEQVIVRAGLMVPMHGLTQLYEERKLLGLELFSLMAGEPAESFIGSEEMSQIGESQVRVVREGFVYLSQPMSNIGLIFKVMPETEQADIPN